MARFRNAVLGRGGWERLCRGLRGSREARFRPEVRTLVPGHAATGRCDHDVSGVSAAPDPPCLRRAPNARRPAAARWRLSRSGQDSGCFENLVAGRWERVRGGRRALLPAAALSSLWCVRGVSSPVKAGRLLAESRGTASSGRGGREQSLGRRGQSALCQEAGAWPASSF